MLKISYPKDIAQLKKNYLAIFDLAKMERRWRPVERKHGLKLKDLLIGDFEYLVDKYLWYRGQNVSDRNASIYEDIFDYATYQPKIASFFMENGFNLRTCHYCNMAYINSYGRGCSYSNHLAFVNKASIREWREVFSERQLPDDSLLDIIANRQFASLDEFNKRKYKGKRYLHKKIELYAGMTFGDAYADTDNHFDLDHLLPKSKCPIIGLSLFNFVPSCQVCNEKLKKNLEFATIKNDWLKISPTCSLSQFDDEVTIKLVPETTCSTFFELASNNGKYHLEFETRGIAVYDKYINILKLNNRYNYHKKLALHILDLKERYTRQKRIEISRMLSAKYDGKGNLLYSEKQIEADILEEDFNADRCFSKLRRDMIHKN